MNYTINSAAEQIIKKGGQESAGLLRRIFEEDGRLFEEDFEVEIFFKKLWKLYSGFEGDKPQSKSGVIKPGWSGSGIVPGGFNVIPSFNPNGSCASLCLTLVPKGIKSNGPSGYYSKYDNFIDFNKAILLQTSYWFSCLKINKENLFLTPNWDQKIFENQFESVIESYCTNHGKSVFI
ncbi:MAG: hypothetical protein ACKOYC_04705, partial [Bacteroidota bacterium]